MEFVTVTFSRQRGVNVDGALRGQTGQPLTLQTGTHNFDLGSPLDYTPANVLVPISGTTQASPMVIAFTPLAAGPPSPFAPAPRATRPAAKRAKPAKAKRVKPAKARTAKATTRKQPKRKVAAKPAGKRKAAARRARSRKKAR